MNEPIMVSYRTHSRELADELYNALESDGLSPWMDYRGIQPGTRWRDELLRIVRTCRAVVAVLTRDYLQSEHCRMEIFIARSRGVPILAVMAEDCFDLLDQYEETKGLADTFMVRIHRLSVVGLTITREDAIRRVVAAARDAASEPPAKSVYVAYCNGEAALATRVANQLEADGISTWVATQDCRVGDNWRQAQARGVLNASVQVVVLDETIARADVLRTEILLAEAVGLPVFTVLGAALAADGVAVARVMEELRVADQTFRRLADMQPFRGDIDSVHKLSQRLAEALPIRA
jgi:TIR domain